MLILYAMKDHHRLCSMLFSGVLVLHKKTKVLVFIILIWGNLYMYACITHFELTNKYIIVKNLNI